MSDLPPGFVLDAPPQPQGVPPGFVLDAPSAAPRAPRVVGASAVYQGRPMSLPAEEPAPAAPPVAAPAAPVAEKPQGHAWSDVPLEALKNAPASAGNFAHALVQPVLHPVDTANALYNVGKGVVSKLTDPANSQYAIHAGQGEPAYPMPQETPEQLKRRAEVEAPADAVGAFFKDRYGSEEGFKNALATDPVGVAADISTVFTGGGAALARAPGVVGQVGRAAGRVGAAVDPLTQTGNALKLGAKGVEIGASNALGASTGAGTEAVRSAGRAGREGGEAAQAFTDNMRGKVPVEDIVETAKSALEGIRRERADAYKAGKADLSKDKTVLDFNDIDAKVGKASEVGTYKGQTTEPKAVAITQEMTDSINAWKQLDPAEFHTPEGLDALKRRLGNIRDATPERSPERVAADRIYRAVRDEVAAQAPGYAKMMADYGQATDRLKEVSRTFSLGERATGNTAVGKLQSATRDGANTNWRNRGELLNELSQHEPTLPYAIAGQAANALIPRGLGARVGAMTAAPLNAFTLPLFSPRIVGEGVYFGGKAVGTVEDVANALHMDAATLRAMGQGSFQSGRVNALGTP